MDEYDSVVKYLQLPRPSNVEVIFLLVMVVLLIISVFVLMYMHNRREREAFGLSGRSPRRRTGARLTVNLPVELTTKGATDPILADIVDISSGGLKVISESPKVLKKKKYEIITIGPPWIFLKSQNFRVIRKSKFNDSESYILFCRWCKMDRPRRNSLIQEIYKHYFDRNRKKEESTFIRLG